MKMEFIKGEKVKFNLKGKEAEELAEELSFTYGKEYLVHSVGRLLVILIDDNNSKVAWTLETASNTFVRPGYKEPVVELKRCKECKETFKWDDDVLMHGDNVYHKECVEVFPISYGIQVIGGDYIGESDNDDGQSAYDALRPGEYEEEEE